jgi:hypothetical protein
MSSQEDTPGVNTTDMTRNYRRVLIVWVVTLSALYLAQWYFTHS